VKPTAASWENSERARIAARIPAPTNNKKPATTAVVPSSPSSSPMAAKMKSLYATGCCKECQDPGPIPSDRPDQCELSWTV